MLSRKTTKELKRSLVEDLYHAKQKRPVEDGLWPPIGMFLIALSGVIIGIALCN